MTLTTDLKKAIADAGDFKPELVNKTLESPDLSPDEKTSAGHDIAATGQVFPDDKTSEMHAQVWIWNTKTQNLIRTDEMVYEDINQAMETMDFLVSYLLDGLDKGLDPVAPKAPAVTALPLSISSYLLENDPEAPPLSGPIRPDRGALMEAAYLPALPLVGRDNEIFDHVIIPEGLSLRGAFSPWSLKIPLSFGIEGRFSWQHLRADEGDYYTITGELLSLQLGALVSYQPFSTKAILNRLVLYGSLGMGAGLIPHLRIDYSGGMKPRETGVIGAYGYASLGAEFFITNNFYADLGILYIQYLPLDTSLKELGLLAPMAGLGWKF